MTAQMVSKTVKITARKMIGAGVGALIGMGLGIVSTRLFVHTIRGSMHGLHGITRGQATAQLLIAMGLAVFVSLVVHELGHLIGGQIVGFRLYLFTAGPLRIDRAEDDRLKISFNKELPSYGGMCGSIPLDDADILNRFAFSIVCGPVASLILSFLAFAGAMAPFVSNGLPRFEMQMLAATSLMIGIFTIIPMPNGAFLTDGARWLRLKRGGPLAERDEALLRLYSYLNSGKAPSLWSEELIARTLAVSDESMFEAAGLYFSYRNLLDTKRVPQAGEHLKRAYQMAVEKYRPMAVNYMIELAWFEAWHNNNPAAAQALLKEAGTAANQRRYNWDRKRAQAAIAIRTGDVEVARQLIDDVGAKLPTSQAVLHSKAQWEEMQQQLSQ